MTGSYLSPFCRERETEYCTSKVLRSFAAVNWTQCISNNKNKTPLVERPRHASVNPSLQDGSEEQHSADESESPGATPEVAVNSSVSENRFSSISTSTAPNVDTCTAEEEPSRYRALSDVLAISRAIKAVAQWRAVIAQRKLARSLIVMAEYRATDCGSGAPVVEGQVVD